MGKQSWKTWRLLAGILWVLAIAIELTLSITGFVRLLNHTIDDSFRLAQVIWSVIAVVLMVSAIAVFIAVMLNPNAKWGREKNNRRVEGENTTQEKP